MRSLEQALIDHELLTLRVMGEWWELDLTGTAKNDAVEALAEALVRVDMQQEMIFLPPEEEAAMSDLAEQGGRAPVAVFSRTHGDVRMMGPGRMEREEPWLDPISATEALWYRGFVYRGFDETAESFDQWMFQAQKTVHMFMQVPSLDAQFSFVDRVGFHWKGAVDFSVNNLKQETASGSAVRTDRWH